MLGAHPKRKQQPACQAASTSHTTQEIHTRAAGPRPGPLASSCAALGRNWRGRRAVNAHPKCKQQPAQQVQGTSQHACTPHTAQEQHKRAAGQRPSTLAADPWQPSSTWLDLPGVAFWVHTPNANSSQRGSYTALHNMFTLHTLHKNNTQGQLGQGQAPWQPESTAQEWPGVSSLGQGQPSLHRLGRLSPLPSLWP